MAQNIVMGDVIQQMLDVERQATAAVQQAEQEAREILLSAREQGQRLVEEATSEAHAASREMRDAAEKQSRAQRDEMIRRAGENDAPALQAARKRMDQVARFLAEQVAGG